MENNIQEKSKSQVKREVEALQKLGEELIKLPRQKLKSMNLSEKLFNALIDAQSIKSHVAGRRQRQFIGALMRDVNPEPIRQALLQINAGLPMESKITQETKKWIDRLLTGSPDAVEELVSEYQGLGRQRLRQLLRNIKKEKTASKPSKSLKTLKQLIMKSMDDRSGNV